jgi:hypothetical protein
MVQYAPFPESIQYRNELFYEGSLPMVQHLFRICSEQQRTVPWYGHLFQDLFSIHRNELFHEGTVPMVWHLFQNLFRINGNKLFDKVSIVRHLFQDLFPEGSEGSLHKSVIFFPYCHLHPSLQVQVGVLNAGVKR